MSAKRGIVLGLLVALSLSIGACGGAAPTPTPTSPPPTATPIPSPTPTPRPSPTPTETPIPYLRQWAGDAIASSQYGDPSWSALQAVGEPDTEACGDSDAAWASERGDTVEWLIVYYDTLVYATEVNIVQNYNADQVVQVDLVDQDGNFVTVYTQEPHLVEKPCPYTLSIPLDQTDFLVQGVRITVDQSALGLGWNEIDAVELVGLPGEGVAERPVIEPTATPTPFPPPEGFVWRLGGEGEGGISSDQFTNLGKMDTSADNLVYVADALEGIWVFDAEGNQVNRIIHDDLNNPTDVKIGPDGNVYVAAWGNNQVFVFTPGGALVTRWGEAGTGDGQFGEFSPQALAVGPDGSVYVLDENEDEAGNKLVRVQKFGADGAFVGAFPIPGAFFGATAMDVGPDGNLYVVGWMAGEIMKFDPEGNLLGRLAGSALAGASPTSLDFDAEGNMYLAVGYPAGVMKLDPMGNLLAQFGVPVEGGEHPWPEGGFYRPTGAAVLADGSRVFVADQSSYFTYITAFEFK